MTKNSAISAQRSGNTKQIAASKNWCFTLNNYSEKEIEDIKNKFSAISAKFIVAKEVGENGTPHLQGFLAMEKRGRPSELKLSKRIHWEKCKGSEEQNVKYCSKDGNIILSKGVAIKKPLKILPKEKLYKWQLDIIKIIESEPDDRSIYWYWEPTGNMGKTTFAKYLSHHYNAVPIEGKKNDILFCAAEFESDIYIFDFERSMEEYISYAAMEKIKNGFFMCSKYESKPILRNPPHVICFANFLPDDKMLSKDRWKIVRIQ